MKKEPTAEDQQLKARLDGVMPVVDLAGDAFTATWHDKELLLRSNTGTIIHVYDLALAEDAQSYLCFYHLPSKSQVIIPEDIIKLPEDTVLLKIPNEFFIDPVGVARQYGLEDTFLLKQYPIRTGLRATVVPIEQSGLTELIGQNLQKAKAKKSVSSFFRKIKKDKSKGKGI